MSVNKTKCDQIRTLVACDLQSWGWAGEQQQAGVDTDLYSGGYINTICYLHCVFGIAVMATIGHMTCIQPGFIIWYTHWCCTKIHMCAMLDDCWTAALCRLARPTYTDNAMSSWCHGLTFAGHTTSSCKFHRVQFTVCIEIRQLGTNYVQTGPV